MQLIIEAIVVGVVLVILWVILRPIIPTGDLPALFILAALAHFGFEVSGANKWYCKNGRACITNA